jgi:hypothetical protein
MATGENGGGCFYALVAASIVAPVVYGVFYLADLSSERPGGAIAVIEQPNVAGQLPALMLVFGVIVAAAAVLAILQVIVSLGTSRKRRARCLVTFAHEREALAAKLEAELPMFGIQTRRLEFVARDHEETLQSIKQNIAWADVVLVVPAARVSFAHHEVLAAHQAEKPAIFVAQPGERLDIATASTRFPWLDPRAIERALPQALPQLIDFMAGTWRDARRDFARVAGSWTNFFVGMTMVGLYAALCAVVYLADLLGDLWWTEVWSGFGTLARIRQLASVWVMRGLAAAVLFYFAKALVWAVFARIRLLRYLREGARKGDLDIASLKELLQTSELWVQLLSEQNSSEFFQREPLAAPSALTSIATPLSD